MPCKKCEKTVFFHVFRDTLHKVRKNCEKTAFFELFARCPAKSVRKQCFFTFFETLCTKFAKIAKKQRFLSFLHDVLQKVLENSVFSRFSRHFARSSQKCEKTAFLSFCTMYCKKQKAQKTLFLLIFMRTLYKASRKT